MKTGIEYLTSSSKRSLDLIGGMAMLGAASPLEISIAAAAAIDTHSFNPFFVQGRIGKDNVPFSALKFRSLPRGASTEVQYGTFDPRARRIGQALRQSGLDELPQVCNVILGSMSLVGARPMIEADIDYMKLSAPEHFDEWYAYYQATKPGLAGPSQTLRHHYLNGHDEELYRISAQMDLEYFEAASLLGDLHILATTPVEMLRANIGVVDNLQVT